MTRSSQLSQVALLRHRRVITTVVVVLVLAGLTLLGIAGREALRAQADGRAGDPVASGPVAPDGSTSGQPTDPDSPVASGPGSTAHKDKVTGPDPVNIEIPHIGVHTKILRLGLAADGTVQVPPFNHADEVGWYTHSPVPGDNGPSVLIGHIDSPQGPAVFYRLATLNTGDQVRIRRKDGSVAVFRITAIRTVAKSHFPTRSVYGNLKYPGLRLITCGGAFDPTAGGYQGNTIAYGSLAKIIPAHS